MKIIRFTKKGLYCVPGKFYLDPWFPVDYAVISHGHSDHARWGMKHYLCHEHTKGILQHRISPTINVETLAYNETKLINGVKVSFHPAGHIIGSSQIRLEYKGQVAVFSGDYKVKNDGLTTPFEPVKCHTFITESTFGLPIYNWKPEAQIQKELTHWISNNQSNHRTSVLIGYSLGKAQRILNLVKDTGPVFVHTSINHLNNAISNAGVQLPQTKLWTAQTDKNELKDAIVIVPPSLVGSNMIKRIPNAATAICSGWMQIRGHRRWQSVDAGFVISDHADWNGLISAVKATEAEEVYVTHGYQAIFSKYLNEIGIKAAEVKTEYGLDESQVEETAEKEVAR
ncbi:MAG: ligase-associated DNA damage response exonuclease [bacterium]